MSNESRLDRLLGFLEQDPGNASLLLDAAETALTERKPDIASDLIVRLAATAPLSERALGVAGLAALQAGRFAAAADVFAQLHASHPADPSLRFNLAWCRAMLKQRDAALALLDDATTSALPQAAMLQVQLMHDQGRFDEAMESAKRHLAAHPTDAGLLAAVSVLALDVEDAELAAACARGAGDHPDALTTLGTLALGEDHAEAHALFARALRQNDGTPRAWIGKGLAQLAAGDHASAARDIERGARLFGDHIGSWIAVGWAQLIGDNLAAARKSFETALALDDTFAESHGSLAVLDTMEGDLASARRRADIALRLDSRSYAGALARSLVLEAEGKPDAARAIVERALRAPIDASGKTLAHVLAMRGRST